MLQNVSVLQNLRRFRAVAVVLGNDQDNFAAFYAICFCCCVGHQRQWPFADWTLFFAAVVLLATVKF